MKWVKIEDGCEMPADGDAGLIVVVDFTSNKETHLAWYEGGQFELGGDLDMAVWVQGGKITHWARVELPEE